MSCNVKFWNVDNSLIFFLFFSREISESLDSLDDRACFENKPINGSTISLSSFGGFLYGLIGESDIIYVWHYVRS